jgi:hypothetical protein
MSETIFFFYLLLETLTTWDQKQPYDLCSVMGYIKVFARRCQDNKATIISDKLKQTISSKTSV